MLHLFHAPNLINLISINDFGKQLVPEQLSGDSARREYATPVAQKNVLIPYCLSGASGTFWPPTRQREARAKCDPALSCERYATYFSGNYCIPLREAPQPPSFVDRGNPKGHGRI
jgi:hypothetical protein